jgi:hypothetical protein
MGAAAARRAPEVELARAAGDRPAHGFPIEDVVRAAVTVLAQARGPRHADPVAKADGDQAADRLGAVPRHDDPEVCAERRQHHAEEALCVDRRAEIPHVDLERAIEAVQQLLLGSFGDLEALAGRLPGPVARLLAQALPLLVRILLERQHQIDPRLVALRRPALERRRLTQLEDAGSELAREPQRGLEQGLLGTLAAGEDPRAIEKRKRDELASPAQGPEAHQRQHSGQHASLSRREVAGLQPIGFSQDSAPQRRVSQSGSGSPGDELVPLLTGICDALDLHDGEYTDRPQRPWSEAQRAMSERCGCRV